MRAMRIGGGLLGLWLAFGGAFAQDRMDSQDSLNVARSSAMDRARNGYLSDALAAAQNAVQIAQERLGPTHPFLCSLLLDRATLERTLGQYPETEKTLLWALALLQKNDKLDDPLYPQALLSLCALYLDWGRPQDAEFWGQKGVMALESQNAGLSQRIQGLRLASQAEKDLGDSIAALRSIAKARGLCQQLDPKDPRTEILVLTELSQVQALLRRFPEAQNSLEQALSLAKSLPEGSIEMADTLEAQGALFASQGQKEKAQADFVQALPIYRKFVGSFFGFSILEYVRKLERAELRMGLFKEAEELGQKSLKTYQDCYGSEHPRTALALMDLARAQKGSKEDKAAGDGAVEALRILLLTFPVDNPLVQQAKALAQQLGR